jgi:hypothetical protein
MVLVFHSVQFLPSQPGLIWALSKPGHHGVALFFVLSGHLIGILYLRELAANGYGDAERFILRRKTRTIPPYPPTLAPAFPGSYFLEKEHFHWEHLLFPQNYPSEIPYFMPSWSPCAEEHAYLLPPFVISLLAMIIRRLRIASTAIATILPASPSILRAVEYMESSFWAIFSQHPTFIATHCFPAFRPPGPHCAIPISLSNWASIVPHPDHGPRGTVEERPAERRAHFRARNSDHQPLFMLVALCLVHGRQSEFSRSKAVALLLTPTGANACAVGNHDHPMSCHSRPHHPFYKPCQPATIRSITHVGQPGCR